jgi:hypothetical protein
MRVLGRRDGAQGGCNVLEQVRWAFPRLGLSMVTLLVVLAACAGQPGPEVIIPPGVASTQTADEVSEKMLAMIAVNERAVGRALAQPRIIRIQLLKPGEAWSILQLDGTGSMGGEPRPHEEGPRWLVEAVGTFVDPIGRDGGLATSIGTHGYQVWGDDGNGSYDWFPCWVRRPGEWQADNMEGECAPPAP